MGNGESPQGRTPLEFALVEGSLDWLDAPSLLSAAISSGIEGYEELRMLSVGLAAELIIRGFMEPGDIVDGEFQPWGLTNGQAIERITREWITDWSTVSPDIGAIVWMRNTEAGDDAARKIIDRYQ